MRQLTALSLLATVLCAGVAVGAPAPIPPPAKVTAPAPAVAPPAEPGRHALEAADVDTWLDGFIPYALTTGDIAGAVVVVVKDGQVLTKRGFGYSDLAAKRPVDPDLTLFRPGSVSKLFTWTAVMQLVEAGKINLDADVNGYLDFKIPAYDGKPVTMRNLMTHTPGFEETGKHLFIQDAEHLPTLAYALKRWVPDRMFPPGEIPAYSNYGAALAGYIVERVSGEPFSDYIERHVFLPIGMEHSTFAQPLPARLAATMSKGYPRASEPPKPYELVGPTPAGSSAVTGGDVARFMIAHLQDGHIGAAEILKPETARLMHTPTNQPTPPFPGMALGFYRDDRNGHVVIAHGGDTELFHSDLHLFLAEGVGLFVSFNSLGKDGAADSVRTQLYNGFADRYFPAPPATELPTAATASADAAVVAGNYWASRRSATNFLVLASLADQLSITAKPDGELVTPQLKTAGGGIKHWREVAPLLWQEIDGKGQLKVIRADGHVHHFTLGDIPAVEVFQPVPVAYDARWNLPLFYASCAVLVLAVVLWPVSAVVRRRLGRPSPLTGRGARFLRLVRIVALINVVSVAGWMTLLSLLFSDIGMLNDPLNPWLRLLQLLALLGVVGAIVACVNVAVTWQDRSRGWWSRAAAVLLAIACLDCAWLIVLARLMGPSVDF